MSISLDLDIFENKYFAVLFYDYVFFDFLNKHVIFGHIAETQFDTASLQWHTGVDEIICLKLHLAHL